MRRGWMRQRGDRWVGAAILTAVLASGLMVAGGCQKRVVSTQNDWVGSQWGRLERENLIEKDEPKRKQPGTFDRIGETMFGWTDIFGGEDEEDVEKYKFGYTGSTTPERKDKQDGKTVQRSSGNTGLQIPN